MAELRLYASTTEEGRITSTAHLEPEGDGTHEKVIAQTKVDGFILPPDTRLELIEGPFTDEQEARIRAIVQEMLPSE